MSIASSHVNFERVTIPPNRLRDVTQRQASFALITLIALSALGFSYLAYLKYASFNHYSQDSAQFGYAFHQTLRGRCFPSFAADYSLLGSHPNFVLFLWLPVFWLVPTMYSLFLFQSLMISLAAWPIYLLARHVTNNRLTALIAAAGMLLAPAVVSVHLVEFHDDPFALASLLFSVYFFETKHFKLFALFLVLSLLAKETIALNTAAFGLYALVRRRRWQWVVFPVAWTAAYCMLVGKVLMPLWGNWWAVELYSHVGYFAGWGQTMGDAVKNMLLNPAQVLSAICSADGLGYLVDLLLPLALVLPFGSWTWLLACPTVLVNLLSSNPWLRLITHWYSIVIGGLLWASFLTAIPGWNKRMTRWFGERDYSRSLCVMVLLLCLLEHSLWLNPGDFRKSSAYEARCDAVRLVPKHASVFSSDNMLAHFVDRPAINSVFALAFHNQDPNRLFDYDYVVFDGNYTYGGNTDWSAKHASLFKFISSHPDYRAVYGRDNVFVFQRVGAPKRNLKWHTGKSDGAGFTSADRIHFVTTAKRPP